jgi:ubiquitin carboxyl-terminal hydrolase 25
VTPSDLAGSGNLEGIRLRDDVFSHLPINVSQDGFDIYDGLSSYFEDTVELEGKAGRLDMTLLELPPILQIQLQVGHIAIGIL